MQEFQDAVAVVELLGEALHFPVNSEHEALDGDWIEDAVLRRNLIDDADGSAISDGFEGATNFVFGNGQARERFRVVLNDQVGDFRLRWIPGREHELSVEEDRRGE